MNRVRIELSKYTDADVGVLAGRDRGEFVRASERIAELAADSDRHLTVVIPDWVFSVNSSFILGMLADTVRSLGADEFRRRFAFEGPNAVRVQEDLIRKALLSGNPLARKTA